MTIIRHIRQSWCTHGYEDPLDVPQCPRRLSDADAKDWTAATKAGWKEGEGGRLLCPDHAKPTQPTLPGIANPLAPGAVAARARAEIARKAAAAWLPPGTGRVVK